MSVGPERRGRLAAIAAASACALFAVATHAATPAIATSDTHTLALDANGSVYAWGSDSFGQLGQGRAIHRLSPVQVSGLPIITQISIDRHALALDAFGQVWSWGDNCFGSLGPRGEAVATKPARVIGATGVVAVYAYGCFSLALKADGTVLGWGAVPAYDFVQYGTAMRQIPGLANVTQIATGGTHVLALRGDGTVVAFGYNGLGQLGLGFTSFEELPTVIPGFSGVAEVAATNSRSVARKSNGEIWKWGPKIGGGPNDLSPAQLPATPTTPIAIGIHTSTVFALQTGGTMVNFNGTSWVAISGFSGIARFDANDWNVAAVSTGGGIFASGLNRGGELGQGNTNSYVGAVAVPGFTNAQSVAVCRYYSCVLGLKADGTVWFWGPDTLGQSGDGTSIASSVPRPVPIPATIKAISAFSGYSVALDTSGNVWGWGRNLGGQLETSRVDRSTPAIIPGIAGVQAVAAGTNFVMYLMAGGTVNVSGDAYVLPQSGPAPFAVPGLSGIVSIAAGFNGFAIDNTGKLFTFGFNQFGQTGNGTTTPALSPVQVTGFTATVTRVSENAHVGVVTSDGRAWSWGAFGCCTGSGTPGSSLVPVQVSGITDALEIAASPWGKMVITQSGAVRAWGIALPIPAGANAQLPYSIPFQGVPQSIAIGLDTAFILGTTGLAWGIGGYNSSFRDAFSAAWQTVGDGTYVQRRTPVVLAAANGAGSLDGNDWYLDLEPATAESIPAASIPTALAIAKAFGGKEGLGLSSTVKYRNADNGKKVNNYVLAVVPPAFFTQVKSAAGLSDPAALARKAAKNGGFVLAQLTPSGWADVNGQLLAYSTGTANAAGGAANILNGINASLIPGSRFCVGYGESPEAMLVSASMREVLTVEGSSATVSGVPCVLGGVYVTGPSTSVLASSVTFTAAVVGIDPSGSVQFRDGFNGVYSIVGAPLALSASSSAVSSAAFTTSSLAAGPHSIVASYSGDALNAAAATEVPKLHIVAAPLAQTQVTLEGPTSSSLGAEVAFFATVTGKKPTGTVTFLDGGAPIGGAVALVEGAASVRTSSLTAGNHSITASYSGDGDNTSGSSAARTHTVVNLLATRVALSSNANPAAFNAPVTITVTVTGNGTPGGSVTLRDQGASLGTTTLSAGSASFPLGVLAGGVHRFIADYAGDGSNTAATSATLFQEVAAPAFLALTVAKAGSGSGTLTSNPAGIACGATCSGHFAMDSTVTLTAAPAAGSTFSGWSGACTGGTNPCVVTMSQARSVTATFTAMHLLTVARTGVGGGTVASSSPAGAIDCGSTCTASLASGTVVTLVATAAQGSIFAGWAGACTGVGNCVVTMSQAQNVSAAFGVPGTFALTVTKAGSGTGTVTSTSPASPSISCGSTCIATYTAGTVVTLAAAAGGNSTFAGWSGACSGTGGCTVTLDQARTVTATFNAVAVLGLSTSAVDFGGQSMGATSLARTVVATNNGTGTLTITGAAATSPFAAAHACPPLGAGQSCSIQVTVTPEVAAGGAGSSVSLAGTLTVTTAEAGSGTVTLAASAEKSLVAKYYGSILRREPDAGGKAFWAAEAARVRALGVNVNEVWFAMAQAFYFSAEYAALNRDNTGFVTDLYNTFFNRAPDQGGLDFWVSNLAQGMPREVALASFMFSAEFANFTSAIFGNTAARAEVDAVVDFYRGLLARLPDDGGFNFWVGRFRTAQCQGAAAITAEVEAISSAYALSPEYNARARTHTQYVGDLYNAFLRRGGDLGGVLFWINQVATSAQTREQVRVQFKSSPEFQGRVSAIVQQGCL